MEALGRAVARFVLLITVSVLARGASASCAISFDSAAIFPADFALSHFANINGDEYRDLVGFSGGGIGVMLGGPHATFGAVSVTEPLTYFSSFGVTDLDRDGDDDVVAYSAGYASIAVFRNDRGALTRAATIPVPDRYAVLVTGDFNGDGRGDFAYASPSTGSLVVDYGRGDFTFDAVSLPFPSTTFAGSLLVADLDRDGTDDIVVTNGNSYIYFGSSAGMRPALALGKSVTDAVVGDFDGDGRPDLALTVGSRLTFMMNAGAGAAAKFVGPIDGAIHSPAKGAADLDGDGIDDLIAGGPNSLQVLRVTRDALYDEGFFLENGIGGFSNTAAVLAADLDGDGKPEVVTSTPYGVMVYKTDGHGGLRAPRFGLHSIYSTPIAVADFNNDGRDDYLDQFGVYFSNGDGTFREGSGPALDAVYGAAVGDVNGDGKPDVVFLKGGVTSHLVAATALATGDGLRITNELTVDPWRLNVGYDSDPFAGPTLADVNGDGKLDLLAVLDGAGYPSTAAGGVFMALGNGDGTFGPLLKVNDESGIVNKTQTGDANRDGKLDLMTGGHLALNLGAGQFAPPRFFDGCGDPSSLFIDVNRDGVPDCVSNVGGMVVSLGRGDGTFLPSRDLGLPRLDLKTFIVRDFNRDGCVDLLVTGNGSSAAGHTVPAGYIATGDCHGSFVNPTPIFPAGTLGKTLAGDFNGDGTIDILDSGFLRLGHCTEQPQSILHRAVRH